MATLVSIVTLSVTCQLALVTGCQRASERLRRSPLSRLQGSVLHFVARSSAWGVNRVIGTGVRVVACVSGRCDWLRTVIGRGVTSVSVAHGLAAVTKPTFVGSPTAAAHLGLQKSRSSGGTRPFT